MAAIRIGAVVFVGKGRIAVLPVLGEPDYAAICGGVCRFPTVWYSDTSQTRAPQADRLNVSRVILGSRRSCQGRSAVFRRSRLNVGRQGEGEADRRIGYSCPAMTAA